MPPFLLPALVPSNVFNVQFLSRSDRHTQAPTPASVFEPMRGKHCSYDLDRSHGADCGHPVPDRHRKTRHLELEP